MPRRLPWLVPSGKPEAKKQIGPSKKRKAPDVDDNDSGTDLTIPSSQRTPTSSPQPPDLSSSPIPPPEEEMRPGFDADDAWVMVEDEFLSTAHLFTAKLHRQEYLRRKELAELNVTSHLSGTKGFGTDRGRTQQSGETKAKIRGEASRKEKKAALKNVFGGGIDDEELDGYNKDPVLSELMAPKREVDRVLNRVHTHKRNKPSTQRQPTRVPQSLVAESDVSASPSDLDESATDLGSSPLRFRQPSPPQRLTGLKHDLLSKPTYNQKDVEFEPTYSPPKPLVKTTRPAKGLFASTTVTASPPTIPFKTQKQGSMNPKIQQLLAKRKAERLAAASSSN